METRLIRHVTLRRRRTLKISISRTLDINAVELVSPAWCGECGSEVPMIPPEVAALIESLPLLQIYKGIGTGKLHSAEQTSGSVLVCLNSIALNR